MPVMDSTFLATGGQNHFTEFRRCVFCLGFVFETKFTIICLDWRDENDNAFRDSRSDGSPDNVKYVYRYFLPQASIDEVPEECSEFSVMGFSGSEISPPTLLVLTVCHEPLLRQIFAGISTHHFVLKHYRLCLLA